MGFVLGMVAASVFTRLSLSAQENRTNIRNYNSFVGCMSRAKDYEYCYKTTCGYGLNCHQY